MKNIFLATLVISLMACQVESVIEPSPSVAKIEGKWQLSKMTIGFPRIEGPTEIKAVNTDILSFDASKKTYTRTINGNITENSGFDVQIVSYNGSEAREAIIFEKEQKYAFLTFDEKNATIILYERTPIGAVLADGNSYHYQKVK